MCACGTRRHRPRLTRSHHAPEPQTRHGQATDKQWTRLQAQPSSLAASMACLHGVDDLSIGPGHVFPGGGRVSTPSTLVRKHRASARTSTSVSLGGADGGFCGLEPCSEQNSSSIGSCSHPPPERTRTPRRLCAAPPASLSRRAPIAPDPPGSPITRTHCRRPDTERPIMPTCGYLILATSARCLASARAEAGWSLTNDTAVPVSPRARRKREGDIAQRF
jgi:hypothetical protein